MMMRLRKRRFFVSPTRWSWSLAFPLLIKWWQNWRLAHFICIETSALSIPTSIFCETGLRHPFILVHYNFHIFSCFANKCSKVGGRIKNVSIFFQHPKIHFSGVFNPVLANFRSNFDKIVNFSIILYILLTCFLF